MRWYTKIVTVAVLAVNLLFVDGCDQCQSEHAVDNVRSVPTDITSRLQFEDSKVCYVNDGFIWTAASDNTSRRKLVQGERPQWSSSYEAIVFEDLQGGISLIDLATRKVRQLTNSGRKPIWAPDGRRISFIDNGRLIIINADGTERKEVATVTQSGSDPAWFPDGSRILYNFYPSGGAREMHIVDLAEGTNTIIGLGEHPALSPDGKRVAAILQFRTAGLNEVTQKLFMIDLATNHETSLYEMGIGSEEETLYAPVWSPRGNEIAFVRAKWVLQKVDKLTKDILIADVTTGKTAVAVHSLDMPVDLGKGEIGKGVPYDVWALGWSPGGHDLVLSLIEPILIPAGWIEGVDKPEFMTVGLKGLRPSSGTSPPGIDQDKILVIQRRAGLSGAQIMYGGHSAFVRAGVNWSLL